jgi:hypothetical protein
MTQVVRPAPAAFDYNSTIIGALELGEKKWALPVQLAGVNRHSRHVDMCWKLAVTTWLLSSSC